MNFEVTIASQKALQRLLLKNTALSKSQATDAVKARKRGVKKLLLFIEWSIAWLVRIKLLDKRRQ
jgi:hypothetical protein